MYIIKILLYLLPVWIFVGSVFGQSVDLELDRYNGETIIKASNSITLKNGFHIPRSSKTVLLSVGGFPSFTSVPTGSQNYILTRTFRKAVKSGELGLVRTIGEENQTVQYFDGLGRPVQTVELMASPTYRDIVQHMEYDGFGRESVKYLPYAEQASANGSFKPAAKVNQTNYYQVNGGWDGGVMKTSSPYSVTVFENSPLNRVLEQGSAGASWQPAANRNTVVTGSAGGHTVVTDYGTNVAGEVRLWVINSANTGAAGTTYYAAGKLYKTVLKDENWVNTSTDVSKPGKSGTVEEYKDFQERVVLKRIWESETKSLSTYYVYDDFGDLRYVVPPGYAVATITDNSTDFNELLYAYRYDKYRRVVEKKIPGKSWEYIVYNKNDQPILTQDAVQRAARKWSYSKYDAFGRIASSGIYTNTNSTAATRAQVQALADAVTPQWESRTGTAYTNTAFPSTTAQLQELTVNYYDDYAFKTSALFPTTVAADTTSLVKGLLTGTKVRKGVSDTMLMTVNYYDKRARLIESVSQNHLKGTDRIINSYSFTGELEISRRVHTPSSGAATTLLTTSSYDHVGRLKETRKKINTQTEILQSRLSYNEIGQLKSKGLHSEDGGGKFLTTVGYQYNERGWQTKAGSAQFSYQLNYAKSGTAVLSNAQYNGNIAQQLWGYASTTGNTFSYTYDKLNRLKTAASTGTVMSEALTYDDMGNIRTLTRDGVTTTYSYNNSNKSNRLLSLTGGIKGSYTYDVNGNAKTDRTGMTFTYNHLNLPATVTKAGAAVAYLYDGLGTKLRKTAAVGSVNTVTTVRDYIGGIEYSKTGAAASVIERIATEEGYLQNSSGTYTYHYNLTDHLGNVRAVLKRGTSSITPEVIQKQDYYAFGKTKSIVTGGINRYLYNGKEVQAEIGDQLDYGARFYDAEIGRWNVIDPLAEKYNLTTPYAYAINNPIMFVDPDGEDIKIWYKVEQNGVEKSMSFVFNGDNSNDAPNNYFVKSFIQAYNYNIENGGGDNLLVAATSTDYTIELVEGEGSSTNRSVFWNPFEAAEYLSNANEKIVLSPATILEHEFDHSVSKKTDPDRHRDRVKTKDENFTNKEEERVIKGSESKTGQKNGEIKEGQHRKNHRERLRTIRVGNPTSTQSYKYPWEQSYNNTSDDF
ncbi:RHS repeat-associated core domain-containing protein [Sphingobacterium shayense]|uniref:DUF6443 domain-containing protein n=1 Tax=Sphingobacterium shayense TaxID=626343 RepID=UPI001553CB43|nr:DUF6443 domain-containing protein [Sphingobacterium shayense]NQD71421.1 RHS repeat-associated core domain-containing protein [Sphingobacterium shayense]